MREQKESRALRQAMMVLVGAAIHVALIASLLLGIMRLNIYYVVRKTLLLSLVLKLAEEI